MKKPRHDRSMKAAIKEGIMIGVLQGGKWSYFFTRRGIYIDRKYNGSKRDMIAASREDRLKTV